MITIPMTDLPSQLAPGERATRAVDLTRHLPAGRYAGNMAGTVLVNGNPVDYSSEFLVRAEFTIGQ